MTGVLVLSWYGPCFAFWPRMGVLLLAAESPLSGSKLLCLALGIGLNGASTIDVAVESEMKRRTYFGIFI